ncbi:capsule biosynthesis protein CapA [bacterium MnTg02]|nr:capsule biosynthesis protein CapA [bacterium MnTg02]
MICILSIALKPVCRTAAKVLFSMLFLAPATLSLAEPDPDSVTIVLAGDTGFSGNHTKVNPKGSTKYSRFLTWRQSTALIAPDINGDLNFMNVETVVTDRNDLVRDTKGQRGPFNFKTHPNGLRHLVRSGFNVASLANNHSMDYGVAGLKETLRNLNALRADGLLAHAGIGMTRTEASAPKTLKVKGSDIAFSAIGIVTNNLARHRARNTKPGQIAYRFDEDFAESTRRLAKTNSAYRILSIHYGVEGRVRTDARQIREWRGHAARRAGIDLIVGHHAHVVRGVEMVGNSVIFYGLGNFLHHGTANMGRNGPCRSYGLLARVHLRKSKDGRLRARAIEAIPVTETHVQTRRFKSRAQSHKRIFALNYLAAFLDDPKSGARGIRFTPQRDGSGLYCVPGARTDPGKIGALCRRWQAAPPIPAALRKSIAASCKK